MSWSRSSRRRPTRTACAASRRSRRAPRAARTARTCRAAPGAAPRRAADRLRRGAGGGLRARDGAGRAAPGSCASCRRATAARARTRRSCPAEAVESNGPMLTASRAAWARPRCRCPAPRTTRGARGGDRRSGRRPLRAPAGAGGLVARPARPRRLGAGGAGAGRGAGRRPAAGPPRDPGRRRQHAGRRRPRLSPPLAAHQSFERLRAAAAPDLPGRAPTRSPTSSCCPWSSPRPTSRAGPAPSSPRPPAAATAPGRAAAGDPAGAARRGTARAGGGRRDAHPAAGVRHEAGAHVGGLGWAGPAPSGGAEGATAVD